MTREGTNRFISGRESSRPGALCGRGWITSFQRVAKRCSGAPSLSFNIMRKAVFNERAVRRTAYVVSPRMFSRIDSRKGWDDARAEGERQALLGRRQPGLVSPARASRVTWADGDQVRLWHGPVRACTVYLDGKEVRSCITSVSYAIGKEVMTIVAVATKLDQAAEESWIPEVVPKSGWNSCAEPVQTARARLNTRRGSVTPLPTRSYEIILDL